MRLPDFNSFSKRSLLASVPLYFLGTWINSGYKNSEEIFSGEKLKIYESKTNNEDPTSKINQLNYLDYSKKYKLQSYSYNHEGGLKPKYDNIDQERIDFVKTEVEKHEIIEYANSDKTGFKSVVFRNKEDFKITVAIVGVETSLAGGKFRIGEDFWDGYYSSAGSLTEQFYEAHAFCKMIEDKYGKIDYLIGHSLGAHLVRCLSPAFVDSPEDKKPIIIAYDGPGLTNSLMQELREYYSIALDTAGRGDKLDSLIANASEKVNGYIIDYNTYNTLGIQKAVSANNLENSRYFYLSPEQFLLPSHFNQKFTGHFKAIDEHAMWNQKGPQEIKLNKADDSKQSGAPTGAGAVLIALSLIAFSAPELIQGTKNKVKKLYNNGEGFVNKVVDEFKKGYYGENHTRG